MSRIAKYPVDVPKGVEVTLGAAEISVKGPLGSLTQFMLPAVTIERDGDKLLCKAVAGQPNAGAMSGTMRALLNNMVTGVTKGFEKKLTLVGVGFRAQAQGDKLNLSLGFSHPVLYPAPAGITISTPTQTEILVSGADKQQVGEVAAKIRGFRPPEPYKGKGVKYAGENIIRKEAKKA